VTILAGFSSSRQGGAPLNLAVQLARTTGEKVIAAVIIERALPPGVDPIEDEFQQHVATQATAALDRVIDRVRDNSDISVVVHQSTSIPRGLMELVDHHHADLVVVGSSSSGLLGKVALGSVTDRLVHTAAVPVAIAPRGYPSSPLPIQRLTAAYGGAADAVGLIATTADLAKRWSARMRIASFTVRPLRMFGGTIEPSAEDLVVRQWTRQTMDAALKQLNEARATVSIPDVDVVVGAGTDWREAVDGITWESGDMLLLGSGAAGPMAQVFLGSVAAKIIRHAPVPVMIMPRLQT
jgi:nucleotide-binding universal stress UspA family protein